MNTVLIGLENSLTSYFAKYIKELLASSCSPISVLDVIGDIDNLTEVHPEKWGEAKRILYGIGDGIRMRYFFAFEREPIKDLLRGDIRVFTFVRLVTLEESLPPVLTQNSLQLSGGALGYVYGSTRDTIANELQQDRDSGRLEDFRVSYGFGFEFPTGILIEGIYKTVFHLGQVIEKLHLNFHHNVKTVSYISMRQQI